MVAANPNYRFPPDGSALAPRVNRPAKRVHLYFDQHPAVPQEETARWPTARPLLSDAEIRIHVWLIERIAALHYERHGLWPKTRRLLFGNRLMRWLGLGSGARGAANR